MDNYSSTSLNPLFLIFPKILFFFFFSFCHRELDRDKTSPNHFRYSLCPDGGGERAQEVVVGKGQQEGTGLTIQA